MLIVVSLSFFPLPFATCSFFRLLAEQTAALVVGGGEYQHGMGSVGASEEEAYEDVYGEVADEIRCHVTWWISLSFCLSFLGYLSNHTIERRIYQLN